VTAWECPKCHWRIEQPRNVVSIGHRCNPNIPRTFTALRQVTNPTTPTTTTESQE